MRQFIVDCWNGVMNFEHNPLRHIPDLQVRHMVMQILAFVWSGVFAIYIANSITAFGISAFAHMALLAAVVLTVGSFKVAEKSPGTFNFLKGYHSYGRGRNYVIMRDEKGNPYKQNLPPNDPGGEHE
jgi:hypothetical protein